MGKILKAVIAYDNGDWENAQIDDVPKLILRDAFLASLERTDEIVASLIASKK